MPGHDGTVHHSCNICICSQHFNTGSRWGLTDTPQSNLAVTCAPFTQSWYVHTHKLMQTHAESLLFQVLFKFRPRGNSPQNSPYISQSIAWDTHTYRHTYSQTNNPSTWSSRERIGAGRSYINLSELVKDKQKHTHTHTQRCGHSATWCPPFEMMSRGSKDISLHRQADQQAD